VYRNLRT
jgi:hypothetical protein